MTRLQYSCGTGHEHRKTGLRGAANVGLINFIEYLEVLADGAHGPAQQTLLVHCHFDLAAGMSRDNVRIDGGVRVTPIPVLWAHPATAIPAGLLPAAESAFYAGLPDAAKVLVVRASVAGDYSIYSLALLASVAQPDPADPDAPPAHFDPILSRVDFSFKVECPSDFDCRPAGDCPPAVVPEPRIDYLAKDYASFRRLMLDRMSAIMPDWRERHAPDLGIALVELVAYAADHLSYFQDAVATEAYLGTARQRPSVRRHALLLDYHMHEGANARTFVTATVSGDNVLLPRVDGTARTRFLTRVPVERTVIAPDRLDEILRSSQPHVFEPLEDAVFFQSHNAISFYTWLEAACCLPAGATRATLHEKKDAGRLRLCAGDVLVLDVINELVIDGDQETRVPVSDPSRRTAVRLTRVRPEATRNPDGTRTAAPTPLRDPLTGESVVEIEWDAGDALPAPLCLSGSQGLDPAVAGAPAVPDLVVARGNVVLADHGLTVEAEPLPAPADDLLVEPRYRPPLSRAPITWMVPWDPTARAGTPLPAAATTLRQDPHHATAAVWLSTPAKDDWTARFHLLRSDAGARDFVVEIGSAGQAALRFGDGILGREPEAGMVAHYRIGNGRDGNLGANAIQHVVGTQSAIAAVDNPLAAVSGADPESMEEVKNQAPEAFRVQERAVSEDDWSEIATRHPEILRALATRRWTGSFYTMYVTVERRGGPPADPARFLAEVRRFLEPYRMAGMDLDVDLPRFVPLDILLLVCISPGYFRSEVRRALRARFGSGTGKDGTRGFFHPDEFTFAQPVYLSRLVSAAMEVAGVSWVDFEALGDPSQPRPRFQRQTDPVDYSATDQNLARGMIAMSRLEIARLDNSPSFPEHGKIDFALRGGQ